MKPRKRDEERWTRAETRFSLPANEPMYLVLLERTKGERKKKIDRNDRRLYASILRKEHTAACVARQKLEVRNPGWFAAFRISRRSKTRART